MPLAAVVLVLGAALVHGLWNLILKREGGRAVVMLGALVVGVLFTAPVLAFYPIADVPLEGWLLVLLAAAFETGYVVALSAAYGVGDLSLVYPVARGTAPIVVAPLAMLLLGERPSVQGLIGIALVVLGIFGSHLPSLRGVGLAPEARRALGLAFVTGLMTAGYSIVNKVGVGLVPVPVYSASVFALNAALFALILRHRGERLASVRAMPWRPTIAMGVLMMLSYMAILLAMSMAPVMYVVAAREVSIVVGAALGAVALRERHPVARVAGAIVIFAGVAVLALAR
jgi:drug/metabolite transporter (DMT)-like permease